jgi:hypothetical protein
MLKEHQVVYTTKKILIGTRPTVTKHGNISKSIPKGTIGTIVT